MTGGRTKTARTKGVTGLAGVVDEVESGIAGETLIGRTTIAYTAGLITLLAYSVDSKVANAALLHTGCTFEMQIIKMMLIFPEQKSKISIFVKINTNLCVPCR